MVGRRENKMDIVATIMMYIGEAIVGFGIVIGFLVEVLPVIIVVLLVLVNFVVFLIQTFSNKVRKVVG